MILTSDIGGTSIKLALWKDGKLAKLVKTPTVSGYTESLNNIKKKVLELTDTEEVIEKAVFGIAGTLNSSESALVNSVNLQDWQDKPLLKDLQDIINCEVILKNDTVCAATAEAKINTEDFWYVNWGTGIGGCLVQNNKVNPAEIGHMIIDVNGIDCRCGQVGCWDALVSGRSLEERYGYQLENLSDKQWSKEMRLFVKGLVNLYVVYPTNNIIINGGVILAQKDKLSLLNELLSESIKIYNTTPKIKLARYEELSGIYGAYDLSFKKYVNME